MSAKEKRISEIMFWLQMFFIIVFFIPYQAHKMFTSTEGVILTSFLLVDIYSVFMLNLSWRAHKAAPSRMTRQMVWVWIIGVALYTLFTVIFLFKAPVVWNANDNVNAVNAIIGAVGAIALVFAKRLPWTHPDVRMNLAISFRVIPQVMLALNIFASGSSKGLATEFVISFHLLVACRIGNLIYMIKESGKDRNRQCMLITESLGWATWCLVTVAWAMN
jgi:hypothetical protein